MHVVYAGLYIKSFLQLILYEKNPTTKVKGRYYDEHLQSQN